MKQEQKRKKVRKWQRAIYSEIRNSPKPANIFWAHRAGEVWQKIKAAIQARVKRTEARQRKSSKAAKARKKEAKNV